QIPPEGGGRYRAAGRYVAIARELNISLNHLTSMMNWRNGRPCRYWRIGTGDGAAPGNQWASMHDDNCVAIGWPKLGDLSLITYDQKSKEIIRTTLATHYPSTPQAVGRATQQIFSFVAAMREGDV